MRKILCGCLCVTLIVLLSIVSKAQDNVGIGTTTPNPGAILELLSSDKGFLISRIANAADTATYPGLSVEGMMFYAADVDLLMYYDGSNWQSLTTGEPNYWRNNLGDIYNINSSGVVIGGTSTALSFQVIQNLASAVPVMGIENQNASGDVSYGFRNSGSGSAYTMGMDASDGDKFKISGFSILGSNDRITLDGGAMGIGTNTPVNTLDVEGGVAIGSSFSGAFAAPTNGLIVEGNLGVANSSPSFNFDLFKAGDATGRIGSSDDQAYLFIDRGNTTENVFLGLRTSGLDNWVVGDWGTGGAGDFRILDWQNGAGGNYAFYLEQGTNSLGLGTNTPVNRLDVEGAMVVGSSYSGANTAPTDGLSVEGNVGIGAIGSGTYKMWLSIPSTNTTTPWGIRLDNFYDGVSTKYGLVTNVSSQGGGVKYGTYNQVSQPSGEASSATGSYSWVNHDGTGAAYGFYANLGSSTTTGNQWGIYTTGETYNYFSGQVGIGTSTPSSTYKLYVLSSTSANPYTIYADNDYTGAFSQIGLYSHMSASGGSSTAYGLFINNASATSGTEYGVYSTGEDRNYFSNFVGIGTTVRESSELLRVYGGNGTGTGTLSSLVDIYMEDNSSAYFELNGSGFAGLTFNDDASSIRAGFFFQYSNDGLMWRTGGVDGRMRLSETGALSVPGTISKGGGSFKIDHPLDPTNKYLYHSFVESPDMMNVYNGNVTTDAQGRASVELPDYFEALNRDFRYQLTVVGTFANAIIEEKVSGNKFTIRTDQPNVEVSWQVTGVRKDPFANANRIPNAIDKDPINRGTYLHPEAYGVSTDLREGANQPQSDDEVGDN